MSVELERVSRIHALIDAANSKTGNADTALTDRTAQPLTLRY